MRISLNVAFVIALGITMLAAWKAYQVKCVGEMHKVIMMGEDKGIISLASVKDRPNLYAIAAVEGLNGEITVLSSELFIATIRDAKPTVENTFNVQAPLLVYVQVAKWLEHAIPASAQSVDDLDKFVASSARPAGLAMGAPIPFRVTALMHEIQKELFQTAGLLGISNFLIFS